METNRSHADIARRMVEAGAPEDQAVSAAAAYVRGAFPGMFVAAMQRYLQSLVDLGADEGQVAACGQKLSEACQQALDEYCGPITRH